MQKRTKLFAALAAAVLAVMPMGNPLAADAATTQDVLNAISSAGWPDWMVQQAANSLAGGNFTSEQCDQMISQITQYDADLEEQLIGVLGPPAGTTTAPSAQGGSTSTGTKTSAQSDSSSQSRPSDQEFISMTMDQKKEYLNRMPESERQAFLDSLTPEERKSIIKQMSASEKAELISGFVDIGESLGIYLSIDEISGDDVVVSARDQDGNLVNVSSMSMTVDPTGISYTVPVAAAAGLIILSVGGMIFLVRRKHS